MLLAITEPPPSRSTALNAIKNESPCMIVCRLNTIMFPSVPVVLVSRHASNNILHQGALSLSATFVLVRARRMPPTRAPTAGSDMGPGDVIAYHPGV